MTSENEQGSEPITVVVPPNVWTHALTVGEAPGDPDAGAFDDQREIIEIFHTNGMNLEFAVSPDRTLTPALLTDPADIENYDGWRVRKTPYVDWHNRERAERERVERLDPLAGHPLTALGATRPDVTQRNIDQGYLIVEDTDQGQRVRLTDAGKVRARELLGLPDDFPLDEVP